MSYAYTYVLKRQTILYDTKNDVPITFPLLSFARQAAQHRLLTAEDRIDIVRMWDSSYGDISKEEIVETVKAKKAPAVAMTEE